VIWAPEIGGLSVIARPALVRRAGKAGVCVVVAVVAADAAELAAEAAVAAVAAAVLATGAEAGAASAEELSGSITRQNKAAWADKCKRYR